VLEPVNALLISGTDTEVGKTVVTTALAAYWKIYCTPKTFGILKPIQTGIGDREFYSRYLSLNQSLDEINPLHYHQPIAPPLAAELEGKRVELEKAWHIFERLYHTKDWVLVEGVGGLGTPLTHETTMADLAWDWRLPTVLVAPVRLGAVGQVVANVALARQCRVHLKGIILNCHEPRTTEQIQKWAPPHLIQSLSHIPVLGCLPHIPDPTDLTKLAQLAAELDLNQIMPLEFTPVPGVNP